MIIITTFKVQILILLPNPGIIIYKMYNIVLVIWVCNFKKNSKFILSYKKIENKLKLQKQTYK